MHSRGQTWQATRDRISREIASGHLPADTRLPSEPELCLLYDTRRHSLRRALAALVLRGLTCPTHPAGVSHLPLQSIYVQ